MIASQYPDSLAHLLQDAIQSRDYAGGRFASTEELFERGRSGAEDLCEGVEAVNRLTRAGRGLLSWLSCCFSDGWVPSETTPA